MVRVIGNFIKNRAFEKSSFYCIFKYFLNEPKWRTSVAAKLSCNKVNVKVFSFCCYAAPSAPPTGIVVVHNGSSTSLWITWSDVPGIDQNGVLIGFVIGYWLKDDSGTANHVNVSKSSVVSPVKRRKRASGTSYSYVLQGLKIWTDYYVVVAAVTVGQGPYSEPLLVRTDEGGNVECL